MTVCAIEYTGILEFPALERYIVAKLTQERKTTAYRFYVADMLKMIAENTARSAGKGGKYTTASYRDLITAPKPRKDAKTIAAEVTKKLGLKVISDG